MKIPWVPVTEGGGSKGPVKAVNEFMKTYSTATNPVTHKSFQNLPMNTAAPAVIFHEPNPKGHFNATKVRENGEGAGENYVDSFVTHPVKGNYKVILASMEAQRKQVQANIIDQLSHPTSVADIALWGYRDLGANADEERTNSLRERLRFAGASDEQIEEILTARMKESLLAKVKLPLTPEEREVMQAEEMARRLIGPGAMAAALSTPLSTRAPFDPNVFSFGTPAASSYARYVPTPVPSNVLFKGEPIATSDPRNVGLSEISSRRFSPTERLAGGVEEMISSAQRVRAMRAEHPTWTQIQIANAVGVSQATVSRILRA